MKKWKTLGKSKKLKEGDELWLKNQWRPINEDWFGMKVGFDENAIVRRKKRKFRQQVRA
jgi:hypothetical protein